MFGGRYDQPRMGNQESLLDFIARIRAGGALGAPVGGPGGPLPYPVSGLGGPMDAFNHWNRGGGGAAMPFPPGPQNWESQPPTPGGGQIGGPGGPMDAFNHWNRGGGPTPYPVGSSMMDQFLARIGRPAPTANPNILRRRGVGPTMPY